jgi:hypothetical protein
MSGTFAADVGAGQAFKLRENDLPEFVPGVTVSRTPGLKKRGEVSMGRPSHNKADGDYHS